MRACRHWLSASRPSPHRLARLSVDQLEDRLTPSWGSVPPAVIAPPANAIPVVQNSKGDANGPASITANEVDWYKFTAASSGVYTFQAIGPLDTVTGLYSKTGGRLAFNDDISSTNRNSRFTLSLSAGKTYYLGVTNYTYTSGGTYSWSLDGPTPSAPPKPPSGGTAPTSGSFDITLISSGLTATQQQIFEQAAQKWEAVITAGLPTATYNGRSTTGVIINASAITIDGKGGILGQAGPDRFRGGSYLPYHGTMQFDSADLASLTSNGGLLYTVEHEMGHILGIGTLWTTKGLLSGASTSNPMFIGPRATAEYNSLFGTRSTGVPVENTGGSGTRNAHWRETTFGNELMTGWLNGGTNPLSRITVASLADLGYTVNLSKADLYSRPGGRFLGGGSGGGGAAALRELAEDSTQDLLRQVASDVVNATPFAPALTSNLLAKLRNQIEAAAIKSEKHIAATPARPSTSAVLSPEAKTADATFSLLGINSRLGEMLVA